MLDMREFTTTGCPGQGEWWRMLLAFCDPISVPVDHSPTNPFNHQDHGTGMCMPAQFDENLLPLHPEFSLGQGGRRT